MRVTDDQVATLRAQLAGDLDEHRRRLRGLDRKAAATGYSALIGAAFFEAVDRRFAGRATEADVIEYVGDVRARGREIAMRLDPRVAERLILLCLGEDVPVDDIAPGERIAAQIVLLAAVVADADFDDAELDAFLADVRSIADRWIREPA